MRTLSCCLLPACLLLFASSGFAQSQVFTADAAASEAHITLGGSAHTTHGLFHVERGKIDFDRTAMTMSGTVAVSAASGDTGNASRDQKMKQEVLEAARFDQISFSPRSYQGDLRPQGDSTIQAKGIFTLHGTPHDLTIPMQIHIDGQHSVVHAHFLVPYVDWGLKNPSKLILKVDKQVAVDVMLVGAVSAAK